MEATVLKYAPSYWDKNYYDNTQFELRTFSEEYKTIENEVKLATGNNYDIKSIKRYQNIHDFGQVILREQLLNVINTSQNYYRVRRYATVRRQYLTNALEYNLDHRRCGKSSLILKKRVDLGRDEILLVVQVIVTSPHVDSVTPSNSSDYFIDYIITMDN